MRTALSPRRRLLAIGAVLALAVGALAIGGCGSAHHARAAAASAVSVTERDFHIAAPSTLRAGAVDFTVTNEGPERHEFIVARVGASALPMRSDGLTIDEETLEKQEVGELEPGKPGAVRTLRLDLAPGRYVFFCNMAGHFLGGMHHEVVVQ
jgi:uncharacterized cupredoxin-like copper-binding protein